MAHVTGILLYDSHFTLDVLREIGQFAADTLQ
jgi:hypothetical protein